MEKEMKSLIDNKTWKLVKRSKNQRMVQYKRIFKLKDGNNPSNPLRYKLRLVAKGFIQMEGIDYNERSSLLI